MLLVAAQQNIANVTMYSAVKAREGIALGNEQIPSGLSRIMKEFSIGRSSYRFIKEVQADCVPTSDGWAYYLNGLHEYIGRGATQRDAFEDLKIRIHTDFQRLVRKRPFEMDETERRKWTKIANMIDLLHYKTTTPSVMKEIGQVSYGRISRPYRIKWISGRNYRIEPESVPGELMTCVPGQWIEATVKRDPVSLRILEIEFINKISFRIPTESEIRSFWEEIPRAELDSGQWT